MRPVSLDDISTIAKWMIERGQSEVKPSHFPPTGLIVDDIACGFLIKCDNGWGVLDFFITNPAADERARAKALDEIAKTLIKEAKLADLKFLKCDTEHESVIRLAKKHLFRSTGNFHSLARGI